MGGGSNEGGRGVGVVGWLFGVGYVRIGAVGYRVTVGVGWGCRRVNFVGKGRDGKGMGVDRGVWVGTKDFCIIDTNL